MHIVRATCFLRPCLSNMENITVKDFSRHMSQNMYVITVSPQSCRVSRAVVLPPLSNLLVHADFRSWGACAWKWAFQRTSAFKRFQHHRSNMSDSLESAQQ